MKSPRAHRKSGALDWFALRTIAFYQRQLSPRKGWRCAYARLHGGTGCSGFAREAIGQYGLSAAIPQIRTRFDNCKKAGQILCAQRKSKENIDKERQDRRQATQSSGADWCYSIDCTPAEACDVRSWRCADALIDCGPGDTGCCNIGCCDTGDCNCSPCD